MLSAKFVRGYLAIASLIWGLQLLAPSILNPKLIKPLDSDFYGNMIIAFGSSWFWAIIFMIPAVAYFLSRDKQANRWFFLVEGIVGFFVWAIASIMFYILYIPHSGLIYHNMQPFTPFAIMTGNLFITYLSWCNMMYLWDTFDKEKAK